MKTTCNLSTVKNTPSEARSNTSEAEYYYIKTLNVTECDSDVYYKSVQCIIDMIYDMIDYRGMSVLDNAVIYACYPDGSVKPLFLLKDDVLQHNLTIVKISMDKIMTKICNLSTVKIPQAKCEGMHTLCYYIKYKHNLDDDEVWPYDSISKILTSIMEILEYCDLEYIDNAIICAYKGDGSSEPLYRISNDVIKHSIRIIKLNR